MKVTMTQDEFDARVDANAAYWILDAPFMLVYQDGVIDRDADCRLEFAKVTIQEG